MTESSHRRDSSSPPPLPPAPSPSAQVPPAQVPLSEPTAPEASVWDSTDFDPPVRPQPTEALELTPGLGPVGNGKSDSQPTIISRPPGRNGEEVLNSLRGRRLAHFELLAPIGVGGMAAVIKGRDLQLDRTVALKVLPPEMATDPENVRRFHQEARAAAKLDHENIARVFYCGEDQRLHFIAFEFVQGENLRTILERRGRLPVGEAVHYLLQVATGLAHAASRGVVHRDIKPSNIIITPNGRAKLVDMGLARSMAPQDDRGLTQSGVTLGTFDYISPEQALEPRDADVRSDIYSLGCTFYHLLTGQPPVPEGTAAKKLHFHQHELPIDPRQLNADIPDEVAAIIARMMAKNPRDRYQKPEHLVEHLLRVAQKLDTGTERADGLLYVDAPLPTRPARPLFLIGLAVAAVVAIIFALEQPGGQRPSIPSIRPPSHRPASDQKGGEPPQVKITDKADQPRELQPGPVATADPNRFDFRDTSTVKDLRTWAQNTRSSASDLKLVLHQDLVLTDNEPLRDGVGLSLRGKSITIEAAAGLAKRPTIWLGYNANRAPENAITTALELLGDQVTLRGLRLITNAGASLKMTAVHLLGGIKHQIEDCQFLQKWPHYTDDKPMISVLLEPARGMAAPPELLLRDCAFTGEEPPAMASAASESRAEMQRIGKGGHNAVVRRGAATIVARSCVFGPHLACFRLEGPRPGKPNDERDVEVRHCSAMLDTGSAVFHLDSQGEAHLSVLYSLFSRVQARSSGTPSARDASLLIRQDLGANRSSTLLYEGLDNRYHNLEGFWGELPEDTVSSIDWKKFESRVRSQMCEDRLSLVLESTPWDDLDPLEALRSLELSRAFKVKQRVRELRLTRARKTLIGAEVCDRTAYNTGSLPVLPEDNQPEATRKQKVVDPSLTQAEAGSYKTLEGALAEAQAGDVILIKARGRFPLHPVTLEKPTLDVTLRPFEGYRPVLTLTTTLKEAALFRLHEGRLKLQDLDIVLEPSQKDFESQAVVHLAGDGKVQFEGCAITLGDPQGAQLSVVSLGDLGALMRRPIRPGDIIPEGPGIGFDRCFLRGKGELLWCRASRPFRFEANQTLAALSGALFLIEGSKFAESLPAASPTDAGPRCQLILRHFSAIATGPHFHLRASGPLRSLVPIKIQATDCLFAPLNTRPLVLFSGLDSKAMDMDLKDRLPWEGSRNTYGPFSSFLEQMGGVAEMMMRRPFDREKWKDFSGDSDSRYPEAVKFSEPVEVSGLSRTRPAQFAVPDQKDVGANVENLPEPAREEPKPAP